MNINVAAFRTPPTKQTDHADQILGTDSESRRVFRNAMLQAIDMVVDQTAAASSLYSGTSFQGLRGLIDDLDPLPEVGTGIAAALAEIGRPALEHAMVVGHPAAMAHLHCPVAVPALAAEVLISATNHSIRGINRPSLRSSRSGFSPASRNWRNCRPRQAAISPAVAPSRT